MKSRQAKTPPRRRPRRSRPPRGPVDGLARPQQRLRRDAGPVGALASDELALDDGDTQAALGERARAMLARGATTEHDHVIVATHLGSSSPARPLVRCPVAARSPARGRRASVTTSRSEERDGASLRDGSRTVSALRSGRRRCARSLRSRRAPTRDRGLHRPHPRSRPPDRRGATRPSPRRSSRRESVF